MPVCVIFGAGCELPEMIELPADSLIIAADGGLKTLERLGIKPDRIIGDLDSLTDKPIQQDIFTLLPHVKDTTDTYEAVRMGQELGCNEFHIYGGTGGRLDHTIANIQLAALLSKQNMHATLYGKNYTVTAITNSDITLKSQDSGYVSVFSHSDKCSGVSIRGLMYEITDAELDNGFALGVSNEFIGKQAEISVKSGTLCIYRETRN